MANQALQVFKLSRILPAGMHFPCDFGSIPGTRGEDGDPLDVVVLSEAPSFVGCSMSVRLLGVIRATQTERHRRMQNDRFVAIPVTPANKPRKYDLNEISADRLRALEQFFVAYNRAQGRTFRLEGRFGAKHARRLLARGIQLHESSGA